MLDALWLWIIHVAPVKISVILTLPGLLSLLSSSLLCAGATSTRTHGFVCVRTNQRQCRAGRTFHPSPSSASEQNAVSEATRVTNSTGDTTSIGVRMSLSKFTKKRKFENMDRKICLHFAPIITKPVCLICTETVAVVKSGNVKTQYDTKHSHSE